MKKILVAILIIIHIACNGNSQIFNGTATIKTYSFGIDNSTNQKYKQASPDATLLFYDKYLIELTFGINQIIDQNGKTAISYRDTAYYFIDTLTDKCDQYKSFSISAKKERSMTWKDKPVGLGYPKDTTGWKRDVYKIDNYTIFTDTVINNKKYKYVVFKETPEVNSICYFSQDSTDWPYTLSTVFGENYGAITRMDRIDLRQGIRVAIDTEIMKNSLTSNQIAVIKQWIKNQQTE